ncbi:MAG: beta-hydroxyacyl-ACP dehydratase, partial [SAR324 cluster bacterium]|nr:beta-hydroxyacyl-ACP dehydratase [SAR324 cluster bacterium]
MPPPLLIDLDRVDPAQVVLTKAEIYERLPQRYEFQVLGGVCLLDREHKQIAAFADVAADDWWARGHLPGRPLLPGVLMLEMAGLVASLLPAEAP